MNPITNIKNQNNLNDRELQLGIAGKTSQSWHQKYNDSAWVYIGGLSFKLTEGDIITVFSQWGEVMNINLLRDAKTGKSRGFCFLCYKDQRSTILAVDNFNGITVAGRMIRVDHVEEYKVPKYHEDADEETKKLWELGCAPKPIVLPEPDEEAVKLEEKRAKKASKRVLDIAGADELEDILAAKKMMKKEKKKAKKEKKKEKKRLKKEMKLQKERNPEGDWNMDQNLLDKDITTEADFYGQNKHFDFGKKPPEKEEKKWNERPDFEKGDWRVIEQWKIVREREKAEKAARGEKTEAWEEDKGYLPSRITRNN